MTFSNDQGCRETWPLKSKAVTDFIRWCFYRNENKGLSGESLATARGTLAAQARFNGPCKDLSVRVTYHDGDLWYDLGDWRAVKITAQGWQVIAEPPSIFRHFQHQMVQPEPAHGGDFRVLHQFTSPTRSDDDDLLLDVFSIAAMVPGGPRPALSIAGSQGSGKSTTARMIKRVVDPSVVASIRRIADFRELQLQLEQNWLLNIDNITDLSPEVSDALASAITGDGDLRRGLFTDSDMVILSYRRPVILNGITHAPQRPDLLDRAILVTLERIPEARRRGEEELWRDFDEALPGILGGAFDILTSAIAIKPTVNLAVKPRMADFATWGYAIAEGAGWGGARFLAAYERNVKRQHQEAVSASALAQVVVDFTLSRGLWQGTAISLKAELDNAAIAQGIDVQGRANGWPKDAPRLSKELRALAETLAATGVDVSFPPQGKRRSVLLQTIPENTVGTVGTVGADSENADGKGHVADGNRSNTDGDGSSGQGQVYGADGTDGKKHHPTADVVEV